MAHIKYKFEKVKSEQSLKECYREQYFEDKEFWRFCESGTVDFDQIIDKYNWANYYGKDKLINYDVSKEIYSKCSLIFNNESRDFLKSLMELEICILNKKYDDNLLAKSLFACESLRPIFIQNILDYIIKFYDKIDDNLYIYRYNNEVYVSKKYSQDSYTTILSSNYNFNDIKSDIYVKNHEVGDLAVKPIKPSEQQIKEQQQQKYNKEKELLPSLREKLSKLQEEYQVELKRQEEIEKLYAEHVGYLFTCFTTIYGPGFDEPSELEIISRSMNYTESKIKEIENFNNEILEKACIEEYEKALAEYNVTLKEYNKNLRGYKKDLDIQKDCIKYRDLFLEHFGLSLKDDFSSCEISNDQAYYTIGVGGISIKHLKNIKNQDNENKIKKLQKTNMYGNIIY